MKPVLVGTKVNESVCMLAKASCFIIVIVKMLAGITLVN